MLETPKKYGLERKLEKGVADFFKYLLRKPKNRYEVMDKHALIFEILAIISMLFAVYIRARG